MREPFQWVLLTRDAVARCATAQMRGHASAKLSRLIFALQFLLLSILITQLSSVNHIFYGDETQPALCYIESCWIKQCRIWIEQAQSKGKHNYECFKRRKHNEAPTKRAVYSQNTLFPFHSGRCKVEESSFILNPALSSSWESFKKAYVYVVVKVYVCLQMKCYFQPGKTNKDGSHLIHSSEWLSLVL